MALVQSREEWKNTKETKLIYKRISVGKRLLSSGGNFVCFPSHNEHSAKLSFLSTDVTTCSKPCVAAINLFPSDGHEADMEVMHVRLFVGNTANFVVGMRLLSFERTPTFTRWCCWKGQFFLPIPRAIAGLLRVALLVALFLSQNFGTFCSCPSSPSFQPRAEFSDYPARSHSRAHAQKESPLWNFNNIFNLNYHLRGPRSLWEILDHMERGDWH